MKSLYESILSKSGVGAEVKVQQWLEKYTNLKQGEWELDKKGVINVPEATLIFTEAAEKLTELPKFIRFGEVGGGVYSIPVCQWKTFEGFPHTLGTNTAHGFGRGRFIMTTDSDTIDYMPKIVKKDPHAKNPIEITFTKVIKKCKADIPADTIIHCKHAMNQEEMDKMNNVLRSHALGIVYIKVLLDDGNGEPGDFDYYIYNRKP